MPLAYLVSRLNKITNKGIIQIFKTETLRISCKRLDRCRRSTLDLQKWHFKYKKIKSRTGVIHYAIENILCGVFTTGFG